MLRFGTISEAKADKGLYRVKIDEDDITTSLIPVIVRNSKGTKYESPLKVGEHVAIHMDERCENGVILGAIYSDKDTPAGGASDDVFRTTFEDGSYVKFDKSSGQLTVNTTGKVVVDSAAEVEVTCTKLTVTGDVEINGSITGSNGIDITGDVTASGDIKTTAGDIETSTGDVKAGLITLINHKHGGVTSGMSSTSPSIP